MKSRVALVSGASRGLGRAIARELARRGHIIAVGYREGADAAQAVVDDIGRAGGSAFRLQFEVADGLACQQAAAAVKERCGSLDILVNNAGVVEEAPALAMDDAAWERVLSVCLTGAFRLARAAAKYMVLARWGRIINISSVVARQGGRRRSGAHFGSDRGFASPPGKGRSHQHPKPQRTQRKIPGPQRDLPNHR